MDKHIIIDRRFCGPPTSGNGGYTCGMLANFVGYPAEVRLLAPPPLGVPLMVKQEDHQFILLHGEEVVARAEAASVDLEVPLPPTMEEAGRSPERKSSSGMPSHLFCLRSSTDAGEG